MCPSLDLTKRRSRYYTRPLPLPHFVYTRRLYCLHHHLVVSGCAVIGCPTLRTKMSQRQAECSIITRPIFVGWREWVWCTRLTHSCVPFTGPYKEKESSLYSAFTTFHLHPTSILPMPPSCGFWLCCADWLSHIADKNIVD